MNNRNTPTLETEKLLLRRFTETDLEALFAIFSDEETNIYLPWFPLVSMEEARAFFEERYAKVYRQMEGYRYAICLKSDDVPIGYINVSTDESHDLGYGLRKEFWHRGLVVEAGKAVLEQVKKDGIPYVTATHDIKNSRSGGVMKKLGMRYQYTYEEQWQPKDFAVSFRMYQLNLDQQYDRIYKKYWNDSNVRFVEKNI